MRDFIKRIRDAYEYEWAWRNEPIFFKAFMIAIVTPYWVFKTIYAIVAFVTSPLWIVPYAIWWTRRNRK